MTHISKPRNKITFDEYKKNIEIVHLEKGYAVLGFINDFIGRKTKVKMLCPIHGVWDTGSINHLLHGHGCKKCGDARSAALKVKLSSDKFIEESKTIHNKYDYSKFIYTHHAAKSIIICPIHGEFFQTPMEHLNGSGCDKCGRIAASKTKVINANEQFLNNATKVYNNKYNYTKFDYKCSKSKGTIICPIHGEFTQTASRHLRGYECLQCSPIGYSNTKDGYIYILEINHKNSTFLGYGRTNYPEQRLSQNKRTLLKYNSTIIGSPIIIKVGNGKMATEIETAIIKKFKPLETIIPSFKRENTSIDNFEMLLEFVNRYERG